MTKLGRFTPQGTTALDKDADLAVFLLDYLERQRDPATGTWPGKPETRRLQITSQVLEALGELGLAQVTAHLVEPAVKWFTEMPVLGDVPPQDRYLTRIYPMRFKALAMLGRFTASRPRADFEDLCKHADVNTGWLLNVPGLKPARATMIWLDTLLLLGGDIQLSWQPWRDNGLNTIATALNIWLAIGAPDSDGTSALTEINNAGDAAYALDLLLRSRRLTSLSPAIDQTLSILIRTAQWRDHQDTFNKRALYSALQLARHFTEHPAARATVGGFIGEIRSRYRTGEHQHQPVHFHALALRLLAAHHRARLSDMVLEKLERRSKEPEVPPKEAEPETAAERQPEASPRVAASSHEEETAELNPPAAPASDAVPLSVTASPSADVDPSQQAALTQLVQGHVKVKLGRVDRISGTRARATVYRVHFGLHSDATDGAGQSLTALPDSLRLVIKQGSIESLARTIKRYGELPDELLPYFAKHADQPESTGGSPEWYLVMEDLAGMSPLGGILDQLDDHAAHEEPIARLAVAVGGALSALHRHRRRAPLASNELGWLYLTPITEALNKICEASAFPELKDYVEIGFESNGWRYHNLNTYLSRLQWHAVMLNPPTIGTVHGDCHSRNLMIDSALSRVKFVDLETLSYIDDYLTDWGLLLEDVALYRYLPRGQRPNCLTRDEIVTGPGLINYPYLPRQADSVLHFQKRLIEQVEAFAGSLNDARFKPRLWLAIARNLILLASRQITAQPPEAQAHEDALKLVMVAYAEAIRLLDELIAHLNSPERVPLLDLPFTGQPNPRASLPFPLESLQEAILQLDVSIIHRPSPADSGISQYLIEGKPFAEINAGAEPPTLSLAGRLEQYVDASHIARPVDSANVVIPLQPATSLDDVIGLVRQAYFLALAD
ncbi:MAG: aminoglycoside phosphotransferase family protein [Chloroflexi bacterium]|nr:aminoglycoside phosphotransferase family protein [Chloroflexota bacterium]